MVMYPVGRRNIWQLGQRGSVCILSTIASLLAICQASSMARIAAETLDCQQQHSRSPVQCYIQLLQERIYDIVIPLGDTVIISVMMLQPQPYCRCIRSK